MHKLNDRITAHQTIIAIAGIINNMDNMCPYKKHSRESNIYSNVLELFKENIKSFIYRVEYTQLDCKMTDEDIIKILKADRS